MRVWLLTSLLVVSAASFAGQAKDPYPGSGGMFLGTPSQEDVQSGRAVYSPEKLAPLQVGVTTKQEVIDLLGKPANWSSGEDGTSQLGYDFVSANAMFGMRRVLRASFSFDQNLVLSKIEAPESGG